MRTWRFGAAGWSKKFEVFSGARTTNTQGQAHAVLEAGSARAASRAANIEYGARFPAGPLGVTADPGPLPASHRERRTLFRRGAIARFGVGAARAGRRLTHRVWGRALRSYCGGPTPVSCSLPLPDLAGRAGARRLLPSLPEVVQAQVDGCAHVTGGPCLCSGPA